MKRSGEQRRRGARITGFAVSRGTLGAIELILPSLAARWSPGRPRLDGRTTVVVRVLGGRQLLQALLMYLVPDAGMARAGAVVDEIHGVSMVALAVLTRQWRRPALTEAVVATTLAGVGVALASSLPDRRSGRAIAQ